ncbi:hypothetical protein [Mesorhizobium sp. B2-4-13]|uniref:hypothetical protein n=1 Tax=Mesorhizobium sp. B2-4-13 TaxID=2589936 RepID=UPI0015EF0D4F|nr:hypothetical protein [Mesorhizobium sp. B2-4-13]
MTKYQVEEIEGDTVVSPGIVVEHAAVYEYSFVGPDERPKPRRMDEAVGPWPA